MNKFHSILSRSGDNILKDRAESVAKLAEMSQDTLVKKLTKDKIQLEFRQKELLDMSPDNRYSLKIGEDFNSDKWVQEYHKVSLNLLENEVELAVAENNMKVLFEDDQPKEV